MHAHSRPSIEGGPIMYWKLGRNIFFLLAAQVTMEFSITGEGIHD